MNTLVKLEALNWLTPDIAQLWLAPVQPVPWQVGDYVMMQPDETLNARPFSIANAPSPAGRMELHIRHTHDDWYNRLFEKQAGDTLLLNEVKQQYPLPQGDQPVLFVAGGTGFAPFKALIEQLLTQSFAQPIYLYWGTRTPEELYQHEVIQAWADSHPQLHYTPVVSEADWPGRKGLVANAVLEDFKDLNPFEIYICGPWPMVQDAKARFTECGASSLH